MHSLLSLTFSRFPDSIPLQRPFQRSQGGTVDGTNLEVMGSRFCALECKALLAFAVGTVVLALPGAFSLVGLVIAFSLLMASLVFEDVSGRVKFHAISGRLAAIVESSDDAIIDLSMPGISGLQLAVEIRKIRPNLPVNSDGRSEPCRPVGRANNSDQACEHERIVVCAGRSV
jgi:hypothetical protein